MTFEGFFSSFSDIFLFRLLIDLMRYFMYTGVGLVA